MLDSEFPSMVALDLFLVAHLLYLRLRTYDASHFTCKLKTKILLYLVTGILDLGVWGGSYSTAVIFRSLFRHADNILEPFHGLKQYNYCSCTMYRYTAKVWRPFRETINTAKSIYHPHLITIYEVTKLKLQCFIIHNVRLFHLCLFLQMVCERMVIGFSFFILVVHNFAINLRRNYNSLYHCRISSLCPK